MQASSERKPPLPLWPYRVWLVGVPCVTMWLVAMSLPTPADVWSLDHEARGYLFLLAAFGALAFLFAGLVGIFVYGPIYRSRLPPGE